MKAPQDQTCVAEGRNEIREMIDSFDIKFIAYWVIWIIGVGIFGWLISQPRKKKEDK